MSEAEMLKGVIDLCRAFGWKTYHARPAMTARGYRTPVQGDGKGFPDLIAVRGMRLIVAELKVGKGRLTDEQDAWLSAFSAVTDEVYVWREADYPDGIERILR